MAETQQPKFIKIEKDFSDRILGRLSFDFHIYEQVEGRHFSGKKKIIDAIIKPKEKSGWKRSDIAFGIEFKSPTDIFSPSDVSKHIRQAYDYLFTDFDGFGHIPVLMCPFRIPSNYPHDGETMWTKRVFSRFGVGEITNYPNKGLSIVFNGDFVVWSEKMKIERGREWSMEFRNKY